MKQERDTSQIVLTAEVVGETDVWSAMEEMPSHGFNRLLRAQRYGRWWVLKGLRAEYADEPLYRQCLRKEFEILIALQHHGIVSATGFETVEGVGPCIVMEWVDGVPLDEWLYGGTGVPPKAERRKILAQLLDAVEYILSRQVAHRDLKPSNILVTRNGAMVKLIDFGLSDTDSHAVLKQPAGTLDYISPEQSIDTQTDLRNDIYSLGCIIGELRLGLFYKPVVRRCHEPIERRYDSIAALRRATDRAARTPLYITRAMVHTLVLALTLALTLALVLTIQSQSQSQSQSRMAGMIAEEHVSRTDTIYVSTPEGLDKLHDYAGNPNLYVCLTQDIDLTAWLAKHGGDEGWRPIGDIGYFRGTFDGQGHTIRGLRTHCTDTLRTGLFGQIENATIRNLTVEGCVEGSNWTGGLVGWAVTSSIDNCHFRGDVRSGSRAGGLVGYGRLMKIEHSSASGTTRCPGATGGLAAVLEENCILSACRAQGDWQSDSSDAGGIVGSYLSTLDQELTMSGCVFRGSLQAGCYAGGLLAQVTGKRVTLSIADCRASCDITGKSAVGGLGGNIGGQGLKGSIARCQAMGSLHSTDYYAGGLFGILGMCNWFFDGTCMTVSQCSFSGSVRGCVRVGGLVGFTHGNEDRAGRQHVLFEDCKTKGDVRGNHLVGGLAGILGALAEMRNCTADCTEIVATSGIRGELVGMNDGGVIQ